MGVGFGHIDASELPSYFLKAKYLYVALFLAWVLVVYRFRRAAWLVGGTIFFSLFFWAVLEIPLARPYAFSPPLDRMFNVAMGATSATGHSPFESYQVGAVDLEPLWRLTLRLASLGKPENVIAVYPYLPAVVLVMLPLALVWGLGRKEDERDSSSEAERAWELALVVLAVMLLSSAPQEQFGVFRPFWSMNFLLKPNHVLGFVLIPLWVRAWTSPKPWVRMWGAALLLGALAWVFLMHWSYVLAGLILYPLVAHGAKQAREWKRVALVAGLSFVAAVPYLMILFANFHWGHGGAVAEKVWLQRGYEEGFLNVLAVSYEHGWLFLGSLAGIAGMAIRRRKEDVLWLSLILGCVVGWVGYLVLFALQKIIEPDEFYFYTRFLLSVAAGSGIFFALRWLGFSLNDRRLDQPAALAVSAVLLFALPQSFPYWWNPIGTDRYYEVALEPLPEDKTRLAAWIREHTSPDAVFVAGPETSLWIAALAGRRVLTTGDHRPFFDHEERKELERRMLETHDRRAFEEARNRYHVSHIVLDADLLSAYAVRRSQVTALPWLETVFERSTVAVVAIRPGEAKASAPSGSED